MIDKAGGWAKAVGKPGDPVGDELVAHRAPDGRSPRALGGKASKSASTERGQRPRRLVPRRRVHDPGPRVAQRQPARMAQVPRRPHGRRQAAEAARGRSSTQLSEAKQGALSTRRSTTAPTTSCWPATSATAERRARRAAGEVARRPAGRPSSGWPGSTRRNANGRRRGAAAGRPAPRGRDAETDPGKKAKLAEEAALAQRLANAMTDDAYISDATTDAYVTPDQVTGSHRTGPASETTPGPRPRRRCWRRPRPSSASKCCGNRCRACGTWSTSSVATRPTCCATTGR